MSDKSHLTAIVRKTKPVPTRWLLKHCPALNYTEAQFEELGIQVLDYGCGRCGPINFRTWDNYDPHYRPWSIWHKRQYDIIICNYVLCVLPQEERLKVLRDIQKRLKPKGLAYISVRNDRPKNGWGRSSRGTYQGRVRKLGLPLYHECAGFRIYWLTKKTEIV